MSEDSINRLRRAIRDLFRPKVLVVEDNEDDAFLTARVLSLVGVEAKIVCTAKEALALAGDYRLCFLDLKLPDSGDPVELVAQMKEANPALQIAVLTGTLRDDDLRRTLEKQVLAVVLKPIDAEQLKGVFT